MSTKGTVKARWAGPYGWIRPDGTILETGITECQVTPEEAESDHWEVLDAPRKPADKEKGDA